VYLATRRVRKKSFTVTTAGKTGNIQMFVARRRASRLRQQDMELRSAITLISGLSRGTRAIGAVYPAVRSQVPVLFSVIVGLQYRVRGSRGDIYNILWAVVFGFATLNILSLATRRLEPKRRGLSFGELLAVIVVILSVFLLGWEMLNLFHIFPIKLKR
jgi:hypothetical protein